MVFSKALLTKGLGGLAMIGTGSAGILSTKWYLDNKVTRFDQGLIDFLNTNDADIKFSVKNGNSDLNGSFPNFNGQGSNQTATISIKVSINSGGSSGEGTLTEKTGSEKGTKAHLQRLNGSGTGTAWTWICEITFDKKSATETELKDKTDLVQSSEPNGFFNKLKGDNEKDLKKRFIRNCAGERGVMENREISNLESLTTTSSLVTENNKLKHSKTFVLRKGDASRTDWKDKKEETGKLYPEDVRAFSYWFKTQ